MRTQTHIVYACQGWLYSSESFHLHSLHLLQYSSCWRTSTKIHTYTHWCRAILNSTSIVELLDKVHHFIITAVMLVQAGRGRQVGSYSWPVAMPVWSKSPGTKNWQCIDERVRFVNLMQMFTILIASSYDNRICKTKWSCWLNKTVSLKNWGIDMLLKLIHQKSSQPSHLDDFKW